MGTPPGAITDDFVEWKRNVDRQLADLRRAAVSRPAATIEGDVIEIGPGGGIATTLPDQSERFIIKDGVGVRQLWNGTEWVDQPASITDGEPPATVPVITEVGPEAIAQVGVKWDPVPNGEDRPIYVVHASLTPGVPEDGSAEVYRTLSTRARVAQVAGSPLPGDVSTQVYIKIQVGDNDGLGGFSDEVSAFTQTADGFITAAWVAAIKIDAQQITAGKFQAGQGLFGDYIEVDGDDSTITIFADTAHDVPLVQLRPDGSVFRGRVVADDISVLNGLILQGVASQIASNAGLTLANGVLDPSTAPTLTLTTRQTTFPTAPSGMRVAGLNWDSTANCWLRLLAPASGISMQTNCRIQRISTAGSIIATTTVDNIIGITENDVSGIVRIGSYYYILAWENADDTWYVCRFNVTPVDGVNDYVSKTDQGIAIWCGNEGFSGSETTTYCKPILGTDGTNVIVAHLRKFDNGGPPNDTYKFRVYGYLPNLTDFAGAPWNECDIPAPDAFINNPRGFSFVGFDNFDFGVPRLVVGNGSKAYVFRRAGYMEGRSVTNMAIASNVITFTTPVAHEMSVGDGFDYSADIDFPELDGYYVIASVPSPTTFTVNKVHANVASRAVSSIMYGQYSAEATRDWTLVADSALGGMCWASPLGAGQTFWYSSHNTGVLHRYSAYYPPVGGNAYVGSVDTGSGKATMMSPVRTLALLARRFISVVPAPTGATTSEVYMALGTTYPGDMSMLKRAEALTMGSMVVDPAVAGTGGLPTYRTVTNRSLTSNLVTITTAAAHGYAIGTTVTVLSSDATINGTYTVTAVPTTTTFQYAKTAANIASGAVTGYVKGNTFGAGTPGWIKSAVADGWEGKGDGSFKVRYPLADKEAVNVEFLKAKFRMATDTITPVANTNTSKAITFSPAFPAGVVPKIMIVAQSPVPSNVDMTFASPTNTGFDAWILRTNTATTTFNYIAIADF